MAKRFRDTEKGDKAWYMNLPPRLKCAVDFIQDKCDVSGVWSINMQLLNNYVKDRKPITLKEILSIDGGAQFDEFAAGKIYCIGFIEFQYGTLSEKCIPHKKIIETLKKHTLYDRVQVGYTYPIQRVQEKEKEEDKEEEKEKEEEVDAKIEEVILPFQTENFKMKWGAWLSYRDDMKIPYKNSKTQQAALMQISKYSEEFAIHLIETSIARNWQGLVFARTDKDFNNYKNGNNQTSGKGQFTGHSDADIIETVRGLTKSK